MHKLLKEHGAWEAQYPEFTPDYNRAKAVIKFKPRSLTKDKIDILGKHAKKEFKIHAALTEKVRKEIAKKKLRDIMRVKKHQAKMRAISKLKRLEFMESLHELNLDRVEDALISERCRIILKMVKDLKFLFGNTYLTNPTKAQEQLKRITFEKIENAISALRHYDRKGLIRAYHQIKDLDKLFPLFKTISLFHQIRERLKDFCKDFYRV